jgi:hypothetical protein
MVTTAQMGEAAGTACALAVAAGTDPGAVDPMVLRRTLVAHGACIPDLAL